MLVFSRFCKYLMSLGTNICSLLSEYLVKILSCYHVKNLFLIWFIFCPDTTLIFENCCNHVTIIQQLSPIPVAHLSLLMVRALYKVYVALL